MSNNILPDDDALGGAFWPAFADNMLALVFILVLVIFLVAAGIKAGSVDVAAALQNQEKVTQSLAAEMGGTLRSDGGHSVQVCMGANCPITIVNDIQLQRITFSDRVLFDTGQHQLSPQGVEVLSFVARALSAHLDEIYKIQIEGHTDTIPATQYENGNLELGARRAISVYLFLTQIAGFNPAEHLVSATSYGEFSPPGRTDVSTFDMARLQGANADEAARRNNRRVELLLFYRR